MKLAAGWPKRILGPLALLFLGVVLLFVTSLPATCPVRVVTRHPCPSCGLTRAVRLAASGDFQGAFHMHPLWLPALAFVIFWGVRESFTYVATGRPARDMTGAGKWVSFAMLVALIALWIARFFGAFGGPVEVR